MSQCPKFGHDENIQPRLSVKIYLFSALDEHVAPHRKAISRRRTLSLKQGPLASIEMPHDAKRVEQKSDKSYYGKYFRMQKVSADGIAALI